MAHGGAITFFSGGPRAEGATDFLWMVLLAVAIKLHVPAFVATQFLNVAALFGISYLLLRISRTRVTASRVLMVIAFPFLWPQIMAAVAAFSVLPFALIVLAVTFFVYEGRDACAAFAMLLLCLFRPDGIVFALSLLLYRLIFIGHQDGLRLPRRLWLLYIGCFLVPFLIYFFWRWHYFGEFFPLPFLVKSNTHRHLLLFVTSSVETIAPYVALVVVVAVCVLKALFKSPRYLGIVLSLVLLPTLFYSSMRLDQNNADRFFVYLPLAVGLMLALTWHNMQWSVRRALLLMVSCMILMTYQMKEAVQGFFGFSTVAKGFRDLAVEIHHQLPRGSMVVTEAGLLPYYTDWVAYDSWGLNTREFAKHLITAGDVRALKPDLVMLHPAHSLTAPCTARDGATGGLTARSFENMTDNMIVGIPADYSLWFLPYPGSNASPAASTMQNQGQAALYQCWFVRPGYTGKKDMEALLRKYGAFPLR